MEWRQPESDNHVSDDPERDAMDQRLTKVEQQLLEQAEKERSAMTHQDLSKEAKSLGVPWEEQFGYSQAVKAGDTIYLSRQVSHDDEGNIVSIGEMEVQMRQAYANIHKVLAQYGAMMDDLVEEHLFVIDMEAAFAAAVKIRRDVFSGFPIIASTIVQIQRLAFPELMIEISGTAKV
jgi:enamine deaminase RidA (YjgF/YER057c/UK114 family)